MRPWLFLDVDGVVIPLGPGVRPDVKPDAAMVARVQLLAEHFDLVWLTSWQDMANTFLVPDLGLSEALPVAWCDWDDPIPKAAALVRWVLDHPRPGFAWCDDDLTAGWRRAVDRGLPGIPFKAIRSDKRACLTDGQATNLIRWAKSLEEDGGHVHAEP